jgi:hypothetical protein
MQALVQTNHLYIIKFLTSCTACSMMVRSWLIVIIFYSHRCALFLYMCTFFVKICIHTSRSARSCSPLSQVLSTGRISGSKLLSQEMDILTTLVSAVKFLFRYFASVSSLLRPILCPKVSF